MQVKVQKWGNSLGVRLPRDIAKSARVTNGSVVDVRLVQGKIELKPQRTPKYDLKTLVAGISPANRHRETPTGTARGREVW